MMRSLVRTLSTTLWLMVLALSPAHAQGLAKFGIGTGAGNVAGSGQVGAVVVTPQVRAELLAHAPQGIAPGQPLQLGLQITHQPEWHTYWKNPGDSGLPTTLDWTLPAGLKAGEIVWPTPKKIPIGTLANYGYEGTVLLPVPVSIGADFKPAGERIDIALRAAWLVCRKECIPEEGEFRITLPVRGSTAVHGAAFDASARATPRNLPGSPSAPDSVRMQGQVRVLDGAIEVQMAQLPVAWRGKTLNLFPETPEVIENAATPQQSWSGAVWNARLPLSAQRSNSPPTMAWVVASGAEAWRTELKVVGTWPQAAAPAAATPLPPALDAALKANQTALGGAASSAVGLSLWAALAGALLGGLILNLMPCVFPVLAIKVMGFARHGSDVRAHRASGVAYTAGVVLSFMLLGLLLMALRAAGEAIGWGFQLQSPAVVAALALLFTVIGLNLAGVFEFGSFLPSSVASLQARHPAADAFLSGVLAVAVASPCTAPFMGASLGLAVTLPAWQALAVFAAIGLGMALPYLAASWLPAVARALPRPGAWMDHFRRFMAFPMFGTVVWLLWVLGQQSGIDGVAALLACLVALSMLVWALTLKGRSRVVAGTLAALALLGLLLSVGPAVTRMSPDLASAPSSNSATSASGANAAGWQAWAPGRVEQIVAGGQPVFVDFTAAWCVTCQYNKKTTLADPKVLADFAAKRVVLLRADWTRRDPAITAALTQLGRSGVPVYVIYRAGQPPVVLPEILSVDEVRAELAKL
jgi:thiol:disulfide interchange protein DsbD